MIEVHRLRIKHPVPIVLEGFHFVISIFKLNIMVCISSFCSQLLHDELLREISSSLRQVISNFALFFFGKVTIQIHREDSCYLPFPLSLWDDRPWICLRRSILREFRAWEEGMSFINLSIIWHLDLHYPLLCRLGIYDVGTQLQVTVLYLFHSPFFWLDDDREDIVPILRGHHLSILILHHLTEVESCLDLVLDFVPLDIWAVSLATGVEIEPDATSAGTLR